jgi:hypothetical protein
VNKEARQAYSEKHERKHKFFERKYLKPVFQALHTDFVQAADVVRKQGVDEARRQIDRIVVNEDIGPVLLRLYVDVGVYQANKVLREINVSARTRKEEKGFGFNGEWISAIANFFRTFQLKLVSGITATTRKQIIDILEEGHREGWEVDKIANELESPELTLWRARRIVRTELVKAYSKGHELGKEKSKWETIDMWISAKDNRTRHSHKDVDGDKVGEGGKFKVPVYEKIGGVDVQAGFDFMTGPGDPNAHIENLANCRCTKVSRAKRDERGRLIPKQQRLMIQ